MLTVRADSDVRLGPELAWTLHPGACGERIDETRTDEMTHDGEAACELGGRVADENGDETGTGCGEMSYERGKVSEVGCKV